MMLQALISVIAFSLAARGFQLKSRSIQTEAICSPDYDWAENSLHQTPCYVAASVDAFCNNNLWDLPAVNSTDQYPLPGALGHAPSTLCTCSWASYNLISACLDCQGFPDYISSWSAFIVNCAGYLSNTYFPSNLTLPEDTRIPFWATTYPPTWQDKTFNPTQAHNISNQGHADVSSPSTQSKSTPVGAIVGGVVGGVVVVIAAVFIAIFLIRRTSNRRHSDSGASSMLMANNTHLRSHSDITANSNSMSMPMAYTSLSSTPMRPPTSPTIRTHATSSIRSFPFFSSAGSTAPSMRVQSPPPISVPRDETAVDPFVLPPNNAPSDRKQANGAYPIYDPPTAPPTAMRMEVRPTTPTQGGKAKFNPPAYTEQTRGSRHPPPTVGQVHAKKGSADTQHSITSSRNGGASRVAGGSISVNQLAPVGTAITPQSNLHDSIANARITAIPAGQGRQLSGNASETSINGRRRPTVTDESFSARDIT